MKLLEKAPIQAEVDQRTGEVLPVGGVSPTDEVSPTGEVLLTDADLKEFAADNAENLEGHLKVLLDSRDKADLLKAQLENVMAAEKIAEQSLVTKMLEQGLESFRALGKTITRSESVFPSVLKDDRPRQFEWLREIGAGALIQETVNATSFAAMVRNDFVKAKRETEIPEFVKIHKEQKLLIRTVAK